jgi:hypothetical protein
MVDSPDGPLSLVLHRYLDKPARVLVKRWKRDHPITIALTLEECAVVARAHEEVVRQVAIAPQSATSAGSDLDLTDLLVAIERAAQ